MKRLQSVLILGAAFTIGACDDPNCFAGECAVGPNVPGSGAVPSLEVRRAYFLDVVFRGGGAADFALHRFEREIDPVIRVGLFGAPTDADSLEVERVLDDLGGLTGRVYQIARVDSPEIALHFVPQIAFDDVVPGADATADGWVDVDHAGRHILGATALVSTDLVDGGDLRRHIIREELTRALGILAGSAEFDDSIFFEGFSTVTEFAPVDEFVIRTLHDALLESGMTRTDIEARLGW